MYEWKVLTVYYHPKKSHEHSLCDIRDDNDDDELFLWDY